MSFFSGCLENTRLRAPRPKFRQWLKASTEPKIRLAERQVCAGFRHLNTVQHWSIRALYRHSLRDARTAGLGETTRHDTVPQTLLCGAQAPCPVFRHHKPRSKSKRLLKVSEPFWPCPSLLGWFSCKLVLPDMKNRTRPSIISRKNYGKTISEQGG